MDTFKDRFGVKANCRALRATVCGFVAARGYRAARTRPPSARALSDQLLGGEIVWLLHAGNYSVNGVRKMHALMRRQGWAIGRDQTGRIMRSLVLRGVKRSKRVFTTKSDPAGVEPLDLVQRRFTAAVPCRLWVVDVTSVRTSWIPPIVATPVTRSWDAGEEKHGAAEASIASPAVNTRIMTTTGEPTN